jgi:hypothetical protein
MEGLTAHDVKERNVCPMADLASTRSDEIMQDVVSIWSDNSPLFGYQRSLVTIIVPSCQVQLLKFSTPLWHSPIRYWEEAAKFVYFSVATAIRTPDCRHVNRMMQQ